MASQETAPRAGGEGARLATPADIPRIVGLARCLVDEVAPLRGGLLWGRREARAEPLEQAYAALLERSDAALIVGTYGEVVVGFGAAEIERLRTGEALGLITDLYVEPEARSVGVGEEVVGALEAFCAGHGCTGIDAWALPGDRSTKNFFEDQGFTARALIMHRPTESTDPIP